MGVEEHSALKELLYLLQAEASSMIQSLNLNLPKLISIAAAPWEARHAPRYSLRKYKVHHVREKLL